MTSKKTKPIPESIATGLCVDPTSPSWLSRIAADGTKAHCGWLGKNGYWYVRYSGSRYLAHRVCYYLSTGTDPEGWEIDHIDGDTRNNNPENLRVASVSSNQANQRLRNQNTSGFKGVSWHSARRKWRAQITKDKRYIHLGLYETAEEAASAYDNAAAELFSSHAKTNATLRNA